LPKEKFVDPRKEFRSQRPETHEEWQARMGGEVLAVVRSGLYLDFRFLDMALSALTPAPDERCRVLATDGQMLYYQPARLLQLYQQNPKYLNRLYLHVVFHCVFRPSVAQRPQGAAAVEPGRVTRRRVRVKRRRTT